MTSEDNSIKSGDESDDGDGVKIMCTMMPHDVMIENRRLRLLRRGERKENDENNGVIQQQQNYYNSTANSYYGNGNVHQEYYYQSQQYHQEAHQKESLSTSQESRISSSSQLHYYFYHDCLLKAWPSNDTPSFQEISLVHQYTENALNILSPKPKFIILGACPPTRTTLHTIGLPLVCGNLGSSNHYGHINSIHCLSYGEEWLLGSRVSCDFNLPHSPSDSLWSLLYNLVGKQTQPNSSMERLRSKLRVFQLLREQKILYLDLSPVTIPKSSPPSLLQTIWTNYTLPLLKSSNPVNILFFGNAPNELNIQHDLMTELGPSTKYWGASNDIDQITKIVSTCAPTPNQLKPVHNISNAAHGSNNAANSDPTTDSSPRSVLGQQQQPQQQQQQQYRPNPQSQIHHRSLIQNCLLHQQQQQRKQVVWSVNSTTATNHNHELCLSTTQKKKQQQSSLAVFPCSPVKSLDTGHTFDRVRRLIKLQMEKEKIVREEQLGMRPTRRTRGSLTITSQQKEEKKSAEKKSETESKKKPSSETTKKPSSNTPKRQSPELTKKNGENKRKKGSESRSQSESSGDDVQPAKPPRKAPKDRSNVIPYIKPKTPSSSSSSLSKSTKETTKPKEEKPKQEEETMPIHDLMRRLTSRPKRKRVKTVAYDPHVQRELDKKAYKEVSKPKTSRKQAESDDDDDGDEQRETKLKSTTNTKDSENGDDDAGETSQTPDCKLKKELPEQKFMDQVMSLPPKRKRTPIRRPDMLESMTSPKKPRVTTTPKQKPEPKKASSEPQKVSSSSENNTTRTVSSEEKQPRALFDTPIYKELPEQKFMQGLLYLPSKRDRKKVVSYDPIRQRALDNAKYKEMAAKVAKRSNKSKSSKR